MVLNNEKLEIMTNRVLSVLEPFGLLDKQEVWQIMEKLNEFHSDKKKELTAPLSDTKKIEVYLLS